MKSSPTFTVRVNSVEKPKLHNGKVFSLSQSPYLHGSDGDCPGMPLGRMWEHNCGADTSCMSPMRTTLVSAAAGMPSFCYPVRVWSRKSGNSKSRRQPYCGVSYRGNRALSDSGPVGSSHRNVLKCSALPLYPSERQERRQASVKLRDTL